MSSSNRTAAGAVECQRLVVDLRSGRCDRTTLGQQPSPGGLLAWLLSGEETFLGKESGFEVGTEQGRLDYVCVDLRRFPGRVVVGAEGPALGIDSTESDLTSSLGEPWWRDVDDEEILLFYERGEFELQIELTPQGLLRFVTMTRRPLLADPEQRLAYGVTKQWPPA